MMKNEEAITCIKMMFAFWANAHKLNVAQMEAAKDLAIVALGNGSFIETSKMVPLTLEQLRGMKKVTPVWWEGAGFWCLAQSGGIVTPFGQCYDVEGLPGEFYAYPPAHIDRDCGKDSNVPTNAARIELEAWEPCGECVPHCSWCKNNNESSKTIPKVCRECKHHSNYEPEYKFCCECGRPLTEEAWAELEKRLMG